MTRILITSDKFLGAIDNIMGSILGKNSGGGQLRKIAPALRFSKSNADSCFSSIGLVVVVIVG